MDVYLLAYLLVINSQGTMLIRRYQHSHFLCLLILQYNQAVVDISDCVNDNNIEDFPNETSDCCPQDKEGLPEWLVQTKLGQHRF